jgi:hypothetical protein
MIAACLPLPREVSEDLLQVAARSVCDRPGESPEQCASRTAQLVHASLGFLPRDGLDYILATLVFGHWGMILDSMHDVHVGMTAAMKARTKSGIVQMDRAMMDMVRVLQAAGVRPTLAERRAERAVEAAPGAVLAGAPVEAPAEALAETPVGVLAKAPMEVPADAPVEAPVAAVTVASAAARVGQAARPLAPVRAPSPPVARVAVPPAPGAMLDLVKTMGDPALTAHVVAFEKALAAVNETLEEAKAEERVRAKTPAG